MKEILLSALKISGKILLDAFEQTEQVKIKENQSNVVTPVDILSEKAILEVIEAHFPEHKIITEESGYVSKGSKSKYTWIVDPLDGTSNFVAKLPWFGTLIAVLERSEPILAGVYLPFYDLLYIAEKNKGCVRNNKKITVSQEHNIKNVLVAYSLDYSKDFKKTKYETAIIGNIVKHARNLRSTNCVIDYCYTADGRFGGCINQTTKIWDIAAPYLIVKESGGVVHDIYGNDINFNVNEYNYANNFTIICTNKFLLKPLLKLIQNDNSI